MDPNPGLAMGLAEAMAMAWPGKMTLTVTLLQQLQKPERSSAECRVVLG